MYFSRHENGCFVFICKSGAQNEALRSGRSRKNTLSYILIIIISIGYHIYEIILWRFLLQGYYESDMNFNIYSYWTRTYIYNNNRGTGWTGANI